jgi:hypothetical protein
MDDLPNNIVAAPMVRLHRSVEERAIANYIAAAGRLLYAVRLSAGISERLANYGFDDEELAIGMSLQEAARDAFCARHDELPAEGTLALTELTARMNKARDDYAVYRGVARAAFTGLSTRIDLRVSGDTPDDLQRFMDYVYSGYIMASEEPYTGKLSKRGFPPQRLAGLLADLDALATLDVAHEIATSDAQERAGESACDESYDALREYMKELKGVIRAVYRKDPEVLHDLGLQPQI